jgi:hypothetical protein
MAANGHCLARGRQFLDFIPQGVEGSVTGSNVDRLCALVLDAILLAGKMEGADKRTRSSCP